MEDLTKAFTYALDKMFAIKSKAIVEEGRDVVGLIQQLFSQKAKPELEVKEE
jgi:hypothetical protein